MVVVDTMTAEAAEAAEAASLIIALLVSRSTRIVMAAFSTRLKSLSLLTSTALVRTVTPRTERMDSVIARQIRA